MPAPFLVNFQFKLRGVFQAIRRTLTKLAGCCAATAKQVAGLGRSIVTQPSLIN